MRLRPEIPIIVPLFLLALPACVGEVPEGVHGDVEVAVVVLEGDALAAELAGSPARPSPEPFVRLGLVWDADRAESIEIATSADGSTWSAFAAPIVNQVEVEATASFVGQIEVEGPPARWYRLRGVAGSAATFLRLELLAFTIGESVEDGQAEGAGSQARTIGGMEVHTRSEWSARATRCSSGLGDPYRMAIHHTETPTNDSMSPQARLRQIQSYHMDVKGWCDIGYHYLMSRDGRLWEGRPDNLLGAHSGGANSGNLGISVMGSHESTPITQAQLDNLAGLVRGLADARGVTIDRAHIKGHREYTSTSCPGNALYAQLGDVVDAARGGGGPAPTPGGECSLPSDAPWSCSGLTGTTTNAAGTYYTTSFGCWVDEAGVAHSDGGDNCLPACALSSIGCSGMSGPACERSINWYAADSDRFGCGTRIKVTNPDSGATAVLMVIDRGPSCTIEDTVDHWVLDMSYRASYHLFGEPTSASERQDVQVEVVDAATPLGPYDGSATCTGTPPGPGPAPGGTVTVMGVLYVGSDTSDRISGATVTFGDGRTTTTSATGLWQFGSVPEGEFTLTAAKAGYETRSITRATYAAETWASFGLPVAGASTGTAVLQGVVYHGADSSNRIANATISLSTGQTATADGSGFYRITGLPAGAVTITAAAPGYTAASVSRDVADGATTWGSVQL